MNTEEIKHVNGSFFVPLPWRNLIDRPVFDFVVPASSLTCWAFSNRRLKRSSAQQTTLNWLVSSPLNQHPPCHRAAVRCWLSVTAGRLVSSIIWGNWPRPLLAGAMSFNTRCLRLTSHWHDGCWRQSSSICSSFIEANVLRRTDTAKQKPGMVKG